MLQCCPLTLGDRALGADIYQAFRLRDYCAEDSQSSFGCVDSLIVCACHCLLDWRSWAGMPLTLRRKEMLASVIGLLAQSWPTACGTNSATFDNPGTQPTVTLEA